MRKYVLLLAILSCLLYACGPGRENAMTVADDGRGLTLMCGQDPVLTYNYAVTPAPEGVREVYSRGGYIHPAWTPSGFVLTNIQPEDHRHHYGIWNPWTHVIYDGRLYDLWNLGDSLGTVRPRRTEPVEGKGYCGFDADLDHVAFTPDGETVIMRETWQVRAIRVKEGFLWDFVSILSPATEKPVTIQAYRYQGFSIRATDAWTRHNCSMMTSEGVERPDIDGSRARWIYVTGETGPGTEGGFLFLSAPDNYQAPEPLRIWNEEANGGRGDVFVNFCPAKTQDWVLEPGGRYVLRYRVLTFDGGMTSETADRLWNEYVSKLKKD